MRWFGGCIPADVLIPSFVPKDARLVWQGRFPLWFVGEWQPAEVVQASGQGRSAVVIGTHGVSVDDLGAWSLRGTPETPPEWPGSYTVVVRDQNGVTVFTDPAQAAPIYHVSIADGAVWASSSRALSALVGSTIDKTWLASSITFPAHFAPRERSAFIGVSAAPPGHRLLFRPRLPTDAEAWWRPSSKLNRREAAAGFRTAMEKAVLVRLGSVVGGLSCDLSGGLDSTTLCLLAAEQADRSRPITALTVRPSSVDHGGDLDHARAAARSQENITHLVLPLGADSDPYSGLNAVGPSDEPAPTTITAARHHSAYQRLTDAGNSLHMTGDGGDALLMQSAAQSSGLLRRGRILRAVRDAHGWAKLSKASPWSHLRDLCTSPSERAAAPTPWSTRHAHQLSDEHGLSCSEVRRSLDEMVLAEVRAVARTAHSDAQLAEPFKILLDTPFTDRTVIDAALRFRIGDRGSPWDYKPQITGSMADVLPRSVLERRTKGGTDADHHRGLRVRLAATKELAEGWLSGNGLIDPGLLRSALARAAAGLPTQFGVLEPTITAELWARCVMSTPPPEWIRHHLATGAES